MRRYSSLKSCFVHTLLPDPLRQAFAHSRSAQIAVQRIKAFCQRCEHAEASYDFKESGCTDRGVAVFDFMKRAERNPRAFRHLGRFERVDHSPGF